MTTTGPGGVPTTYITTATAHLNVATSITSAKIAGGSGSGVSNGAHSASLDSNSPANTSTGTAIGSAAPAVASSTHTSSTPIATLHTSSSTGNGTATEASVPTYTGGSFSLQVDFMSILLDLVAVLIV